MMDETLRILWTLLFITLAALAGMIIKYVTNTSDRRYEITLECQKMYAQTSHPDSFNYGTCLSELSNSLKEPAKK